MELDVRSGEVGSNVGQHRFGGEAPESAEESKAAARHHDLIWPALLTSGIGASLPFARSESKDSFPPRRKFPTGFAERAPNCGDSGHPAVLDGPT